jgi:hypothetical protein
VSALTSIHHHFNLRELCKLVLEDDVLSALDTPPPLQDKDKGDPHVVTINTTIGPLVLFRVLGNGNPYVVTPTPQVAVALSNGRAALVLQANGRHRAGPRPA